MHYKKLWLILGYCYVAFILIGSLLKAPEVNIIMNHTDKIIHFLLYFILVAWFIQLYKSTTDRVIILIAAISLGMCIETLQGMTAYRRFDFLDQIANSTGAICAILLAKTQLSSLLKPFDQWLYHKKNIKNLNH